MSLSPPAATGPSPSGSRIGRPPQWTVSRSRKLARLYLYSTLSIERIIKVLEDDGFKPRKNSAQKTIHKMLDNDPRYLRPESRIEMSKRINNLYKSPTRRRRRKRVSVPRHSGASGSRSLEREDSLPVTEPAATPASSIKGEDNPAFDFCASPEPIQSFNRFSAPFRGHGQQSFDNPGSGDDYSVTVHDIKRRVSDCSSHYAFQLSTLIKEFTISVASDDDRPFGRRLSVAMSESSDPGKPLDEAPPEAYEAFPEPGFALPGDFLSAHTRSCADFPGQQHGRGDCWCSIAQDTSADEYSWLLPTGGLSERARYVLQHPIPANINLCDSFGNTPLHLFGALEGYRKTLLEMVFACDGVSLRAVNTAGQTFLHVLNLEWFSDFASPSTPLKQLLAHISNSCPELVYATDVYGRNFFHRAHSLVRDPTVLAALISPFNPTLASRRDAFGFNPVSNTPTDDEATYVPPRRTGSLSPQFEDLARSSTAGQHQSSTDEGSLLAYHARLLQVIQSSYNDPHIEDAEGRNGLHCLAEAIINQQTMDRHVQGVQRSATSSIRPHLKRKLDPKEAAAAAASNRSSPSPGFSKSPSPASTTPPATTTTPASAAEATLSTRLRHLQSLLHPSIAISASHYDRRGMTPLMAFVEHIPDAHDDKAKTLQALLETLVRADPRVLEARNRRGETALLVAARLGRKVALATLLEMGANVHVRDVDGRGVLEVLDGEVGGERAKGDVSLYARLEACRVLLTGRREWGVGYCDRGGNGRGVVREWKRR